MKKETGNFTIGETVEQPLGGTDRGIVIYWDPISRLLVLDQSNSLTGFIALGVAVTGVTSGITAEANPDLELPAIHDAVDAPDGGAFYLLHKASTPYDPFVFTHDGTQKTAAMLHSPDTASIKVPALSTASAALVMKAFNQPGKNMLAIDNICLDVDGVSNVPALKLLNECQNANGFFIHRVAGFDYDFANAILIDVRLSLCTQLPVSFVNTLFFTNLAQSLRDSAAIKIKSTASYPQVFIIHSTFDGQNNDDDGVHDDD